MVRLFCTLYELHCLNNCILIYKYDKKITQVHFRFIFLSCKLPNQTISFNEYYSKIKTLNHRSSNQVYMIPDNINFKAWFYNEIKFQSCLTKKKKKLWIDFSSVIFINISFVSEGFLSSILTKVFSLPIKTFWVNDEQF